MNIILIERILEYFEDILWFTRTSMLGPEFREAKERFPKVTSLREALQNNDHSAATQIVATLLEWKGQWSPIVNGYAASFAVDIADWYFGSKRVFSLSDNLSELLLATDLPDFIPSETSFVANAFAVKLETPVTLGDSGHMYDFIICNHNPHDHMLSIYAYPVSLYGYDRIKPSEKQKLSKSAERGNQKFINRASRFLDEANGFACVQGFRIAPTDSNGYRKDIENQAPTSNREDFLKVFQIALGINLYVQTNRTDDVEVHNHVTQKRNERGESITANTELFDLTTSYALHKKSAHPELEGMGGSVRPHFRRGFWRRPKGFGQDPQAKATEWVRPTWVRSDKIEAGEIPIGAFQKTM